MHGKLEEFRKSASSIEKECDRGDHTIFIAYTTYHVVYIELKKSVNEAKEACMRTVKTSKNLAKKTKKGKSIFRVYYSQDILDVGSVCWCSVCCQCGTMSMFWSCLHQS